MQGDKLRILLVDKDEQALRVLHGALYDAAYVWIASTSAKQVIQEVQRKSYALVVASEAAGAMTGVQLLQEVQHAAPATLRMLAVADTPTSLAAGIQAIESQVAHQILRKTAPQGAQRHLVRNLLKQFSLQRQARQFKKHFEVLSGQHAEQSNLVQTLKLDKKRLTLEVEAQQARILALEEEVEELSAEVKQRFKETLGVLTRAHSMANMHMVKHMMRVSKISVKIGQEMEMNEDDLYQLEMGAMLHDIGKLVLPSDLLEVPPKQLGPLGLKVIREHVQHGEKLVSIITGLEDAAKLIRSHHERYDGQGYPDQLKGEAIPLGARIIAIANAFDKICYLPQTGRRIPPVDAYEMLSGHAGTVFDPEVMTVLGLIVQQGRADVDDPAPRTADRAPAASTPAPAEPAEATPSESA